MGFDVYGKSGNYFRNNVWHWRPLAMYITETAPSHLWEACTHWQTNDGDGLDAPTSLALANFLQGEIDTGRASFYIEHRNKALAAMPDEECNICNGTGKRNDRFVIGKCNRCEGKGHVRPFDTWYELTLDNIQEFVIFLHDSKGFEIR